MPELPEGIAHYISAKKTLDLLNDACREVIAIHGDFTGKESKAQKVKTGMIQKLTPQCRIVRGQCSNQTALLAEALQDRPNNPSPIPITDLVIKGVYHSVRALIVDLGPVWLRVRVYPHITSLKPINMM